jgi:hypothetical protein
VKSLFLNISPIKGLNFTANLNYDCSRNMTYDYQVSYSTFYNDRMVNYTSYAGHKEAKTLHVYSYNHTYFIPDSAPSGIYTFLTT